MTKATLTIEQPEGPPVVAEFDVQSESEKVTVEIGPERVQIHSASKPTVTHELDRLVQSVKDHGEPASKSLSRCANSPDQVHWWDRTHVTGQYTEHFKCRWCPERIVD